MEVPTAMVTDLTISPPEQWESGSSENRTRVLRGTKPQLKRPTHGARADEGENRILYPGVRKRERGKVYP